jgi:hypothetical protein
MHARTLSAPRPPPQCDKLAMSDLFFFWSRYEYRLLEGLGNAAWANRYTFLGGQLTFCENGCTCGRLYTLG